MKAGGDVPVQTGGGAGLGSRRRYPSAKSDDSAASSAWRSKLNKLKQIFIHDESKGLKVLCRRLVDNRNFTICTALLTIYALFGDDIRLSSTHKDADIVFDSFTMMCLVVFTVEIIATSIAKDDYFGNFFFVLDVVSTASLIFDLTFVSERIFGNDQESESGDGARQLRAGRAGRVGARAGRVVRIIRLIRLVKLYRHALEHKARKDVGSKDGYENRVAPGEESQDDIQAEEDKVDDSAEPETRVGEKLSGMITRRVIILVLVMLFVLPQFATSNYREDFASSAQFGADLVYRRWERWCSGQTRLGCIEAVKEGRQAGNVSVADQQAEEKKRRAYEKALVHYVYYHNWFMGDCADTACNDKMWGVFWVGIQSRELDPEESATSDLGLTQVRSYTPKANSWDKDWDGEANLLRLGSVPREQQNKIARPWRTRCYSLIGVSLLDDDPDHPIVCPSDLRFQEVEYFTPMTVSRDEENSLKFVFAYDKRPMVKLEAGLNACQTIFICIVLALGAMFFSKDSNTLVLQPIERMIAKMRKIRDDPLQAMRLGDEEYKREVREREERRLEELKEKGKWWKLWKRKKKAVKEPMETVVLEKTIIKLGGLLALGFGEAGAEIIGQNMKSGDSSGVDAMTGGQKVDIICGFCDIRNFTDATEILQDKVMIFVNQIGEIVHGCVDDFHGAPNKNIGDAFLLVWRLSGMDAKRQEKLADMAVISFVKIVAEINKSPTLAEYRGHPGFLQRMENYRVRMGFGLHYGWAIEGAIGSSFKIDASYLSPNVNMASRLEAATVQFGVVVLMSHALIELCTPAMRKQCRRIDNVTVKGSKLPMKLYVMDLDYMCLEVDHKDLRNVVKNRFKARQLRETRKMSKWNDDYRPSDLFAIDLDIAAMRKMYVSQFFSRFDMAYRNYEAGQWMVAKDMLLATQYMLRSSASGADFIPYEDGPSSTLLAYMREFDFVAPSWWPGYRELTEK